MGKLFLFLAFTFATETGDHLHLAWQNDRAQHKGFIPLEWLKQHTYPDQEAAKTPKQAKHDGEPIKEVSQLSVDGKNTTFYTTTGT